MKQRKTGKIVTWTFLVFILWSCDKDHIEINNETSITGQWDSYYGIWDTGELASNGPVYGVLFSYEHGFEILDDGTYLSRYNINGAFETSTNSGIWERNTDFLKFRYVNLDGNEQSLTFNIIKLESKELIIKSEFGLSIYLKKSD